MRIKVFLFGFIMLTSCFSARHTANVNLKGKYISFDKVKLKLNSKVYGSITLKGYINFVRDSIICFKFFGPLSYELLRGKIDHEFVVYDTYNNKLYSDLFRQLMVKDSLALDLGLFQNLLVGSIDSVLISLERLNKNIIVETLKTSSWNDEIFLKMKRDSMSFHILRQMKKDFPCKLLIHYLDKTDESSLEIDFVSISNEKKRCNFKF